MVFAKKFPTSKVAITNGKKGNIWLKLRRACVKDGRKRKFYFTVEGGKIYSKMGTHGFILTKRKAKRSRTQAHLERVW